MAPGRTQCMEGAAGCEDEVAGAQLVHGITDRHFEDADQNEVRLVPRVPVRRPDRGRKSVRPAYVQMQSLAILVQ
jgi:hypothetical protein